MSYPGSVRPNLCLAEPRAGGPDPFPALRGLGGCRDVGQSRVQLGQFEAPLGPRVKVPAGGGFVKEPFGFAVVIWAVHQFSSVVVPGCPWRAIEAYAERNAPRQAAVRPVRLRARYVVVR
jgi:hypothetical protein